MFEAWYPFNATIKPYYAYTYAFQSGIIFLTASVNTMIDSLVTSFYITMMGQIDMLKIDFREIADIISTNFTQEEGKYLQKISTNHYNEKLLLSNDSFSSDKCCAIKIYKKRIVNYVNRHRAILTYVLIS